MTWHITADPTAFAENAGPFLRSSPVRHTILLTVTSALLSQGPHVYGESDPILGWWTSTPSTPSMPSTPGRPFLSSAPGQVSGALLQTPPYPMTLTELPQEAVPAAAAALAVHLGLPSAPGAATPLTAVNLLVRDVAAFTEAWLAQAGGTARPGRETRLFELERLTPPDPLPPGMARLATPSDRPLLIDWFRGFHDSIGDSPENLDRIVDDRMAHGGVALWELDGTPVSMAVYTRPESGMVRVQYVWTPPEHRRQGFGGAATTAATRNALDAGATDVVLFTDLANPTSNALYPRLGYRPIEDRAVVEFSR
ncbi:GNAT family N-acetyltransferase [Actinoplanes subglobosus]|uniref:GNAT family N-acetyltransferase n=1 Tax=Actinoplanes subglobosus TaxID=1547892 RepID=A0ABV8INU6_9ACTN